MTELPPRRKSAPRWSETPIGRRDALARKIDTLFQVSYPHGQCNRPTLSQIAAVLAALEAVQP